jgi:cobalt/nickel transport system permease protein
MWDIVGRLDPRIKMVSGVLFVVVILFTPVTRYWKFLVYLALLLGLIGLSRVSVRMWLKRLALLLPLLLFLGASVLLFEPQPLAQKWPVIWNLYIKTILVFLCLALLSATTDFFDLIKGLERLRVPAAVISILTFAYRYVFLFRQEAERLRRARVSRHFGRRGKVREMGTLVHLVPSFLSRVLLRSEKIYAAMLSRGFNGAVVSLNSLCLEKRDYLSGLLFGLLIIVVGVW